MCILPEHVQYQRTCHSDGQKRQISPWPNIWHLKHRIGFRRKGRTKQFLYPLSLSLGAEPYWKSKQMEFSVECTLLILVINQSTKTSWAESSLTISSSLTEVPARGGSPARVHANRQGRCYVIAMDFLKFHKDVHLKGFVCYKKVTSEKLPHIVNFSRHAMNHFLGNE